MTKALTFRRLACLAAAGLVFLTGACGDDDDGGDSADATTTVAPGRAAETSTTSAATVTIKDFKFSALSIKGGSPVTVKNDDSATHTYTEVDGTFDAGTVPAGSTASFTAPAKAGEYKVKCNIHSSMSGTLTVT